MERTYQPPYNTEYTDNYCWGEDADSTAQRARTASFPQTREFPGADLTHPGMQEAGQSYQQQVTGLTGGGPTMGGRDPTQFQSEMYPSVYREDVIRRDDRGQYIDPYKNLADKPYGRRLMFDPTHPDMMYGSRWSSELADPPGCYSYPTTTGLEAEQPWNKDMQWQMESEVGQWPTDLWKTWEGRAQCPTYQGHSDQPEYSTYKVHVP